MASSPLHLVEKVMEIFIKKDRIVIKQKCSHTKHKDIPIVENHIFLQHSHMPLFMFRKYVCKGREQANKKRQNECSVGII